MVAEIVPTSSESDGRWRITYTPLDADPLSVADLDGVDAVDLTYSFTPDGFNWTTTETRITDPRLTLKQSLSRPGKTTETLDVKYIDSEDDFAAAQVLLAGVEGHLTVRRRVANDTAFTVGQTVDVLTFVAGAQRPDAPTENGIDTISQGLELTAPTIRRGVLVA